MDCKPKLRFPEFSGEWEEKKISKILEIKYGKDYKHLNDGNIPVYGTGGLMTRVDDYLYDQESVLIGRKGTISKPFYVNGKFWTVDTLFYTKIFGADSKFTFYLLSTINWLKYNEASGVPSLSANNIKNIKINIPLIKEQEKIASFLSKVDSKIDLLEKKQELWETYKKGIMQQIFSQKIRFKDENGEDYPDWEEKKLEDICEIVSSKYNPDNEKENYRCVELEHLSQETGILLGYCNSKEQNSIKNRFNSNNILFGKLRPYLKKYWFAEFDGVCSSEIWVLNGKKIKNKFLFYFIQTGKFNYISNVSSGSKMPRSDWKYMSQINFNIPSSPEQTKIYNFLSVIDKKIEHLNKEQSVNKEFKKVLLQQMFC